ncbi:hypothetical protein DITRI_Ditri17bG0035300 [Diplodiscus trichospermus]
MLSLSQHRPFPAITSFPSQRQQQRSFLSSSRLRYSINRSFAQPLRTLRFGMVMEATVVNDLKFILFEEIQVQNDCRATTTIETEMEMETELTKDARSIPDKALNELRRLWRGKHKLYGREVVYRLQVWMAAREGLGRSKKAWKRILALGDNDDGDMAEVDQNDDDDDHSLSQVLFSRQPFVDPVGTKCHRYCEHCALKVRCWWWRFG